MQKINQKRNIFPLFFYICPEPVAIKDQVMANGTLIHQWDFHAGATQIWDIELYTGGPYYTISSTATTTPCYLGVENDSTLKDHYCKCSGITEDDHRFVGDYPENHICDCAYPYCDIHEVGRDSVRECVMSGFDADTIETFSDQQYSTMYCEECRSDMNTYLQENCEVN